VAVSRVVRDVARFGCALADVAIPFFEARGQVDGPRACLLAGIHGCEYSSIAAVIRFMRSLDDISVAGSVIAVPVANPDSFWTRTPFVSRRDGKNLNRCFPGDPSGTYSEALADALLTRFIRGSDLVIDLHGGDMVEALEPFAIYDEGPAEERARELATAFGLPWVVRIERGEAPVAGTTSGAAAGEGIPGVIAEVGGRGLLEEDAVEAHVRGVQRVLARAGVLASAPVGELPPQQSVARFVWLRSRAAGWWQPAVGAGDLIAAGALLGTVSDLHGDELERIAAPEHAVVLFVTSSPAVGADGLLVGLGAGLAPIPA
jgi:uncharacterized protein